MDFRTYEIRFREKASESGFSESNIQKCLKYAEPLISNGLPVIYNTSHLSALVGYKKKYLKRAALYPTYFYRTFTVFKKDGNSIRYIREPLPSLKEVQRWILDNLLYEIEISRYVKSYYPSRSIKDNAKYHKNQKFVVSLDILDFFPSIPRSKIEDIFNDLGYSSLVSNLLSKLCTLSNQLPQGAPTSPYLSNIVLKKFDESTIEYCTKRNIRYTRYADDLTFSGDFDSGALINQIKLSLAEYGLRLNDNKTLIMKKGQRQHVTGIIVNNKLTVPREIRKEVRQEYYYIKKYGLNSHINYTRNKKANYLRHLIGKVRYILFINPKDKEAKNILEYLTNLNDGAPQ